MQLKKVPRATACDSYRALESSATNIDPSLSLLTEQDGWVVLHCAHATSTACFDHNLIELACAWREHEG